MINQETKVTEPTFDHSEESMEEILASIRKIMSATSSDSVENKEPSPQSAVITPSFTPPVAEAKKDILVLTKKLTVVEPKAPAVSSVKEPKEFFSRPEGNSVFETLVSSSLTPLIQNWLDKNLETIVEKVVKDELKKFFTSPSKTNS